MHDVRSNAVLNHKPEVNGGCCVAARGVSCIMSLMLFATLTGCQSNPTMSNAPLYGQSTIPPPGTANTAMARPGAYAASAPPMNPGEVNGWGAPPTNGAAPPNWNSPSIFGGNTPQPNATSMYPNQSNPYVAQGSIFDQAPARQQQGVFDSFAGTSSPYPGGSFNPGSATRGYESPNSSFVGAMPSYSANRPSASDSSGGSWWDRLTGTKSTVPAAGNPGWNQPAPLSAPNAATAWNDPRNPGFQRQPIPNPNMPANNGWNITAAPNPNIPNPLNTAPNYTNYGNPPPASMPNNIGRTLPASTNPMRPTNTLPASWPNSGAAPSTTTPPAATTPWVKSIEDLPPAR
jgi:hypothetical protein